MNKSWPTVACRKLPDRCQVLGILDTRAGGWVGRGPHFISVARLGVENTVEEHLLPQRQNQAVKLEFHLCVKIAVQLLLAEGSLTAVLLSRATFSPFV